MRILLVGAGGQLAAELLPRLGAQVCALPRAELDITQADACERAIDALRPEVVVNTAAYNLVDKAETEPELAFAVNALGRDLARSCESRGLTLLHVSTDHVFGLDVGRTQPYLPDDAPGPVGAYGVSKLAGEQFVRAHCSRHFVVRTCGLYGAMATRAKGNFVSTMLRLGRERPEVRVVADQICTPTWTGDLAQVIVRLLETRAYGVHHATNAGAASWYDVAVEVMQGASLPATVRPITSAEYAAPARRPAFSVLDCSRTEQAIGWKLPTWQTALAGFLRAPVK